MHATTDEVPAVRLEAEREALAAIPLPYGGLVLRGPAQPRPAPPAPVVGLQNPLALNDALAMQLSSSIVMNMMPYAGGTATMASIQFPTENS